ncbi:hypothetical protein AMJ49_02160 [Parcubacteria bacterium DG_74_2]|nr:MAG: hypothetical protein AMJ49_02160 [Parcubacteria bacterium DG_74_2]
MNSFNLPQSSDLIYWFFSLGIKILAILFFAFLVNKFLGIFIQKTIEKKIVNGFSESRRMRVKTLTSLFENSLRFIIWLIVVLVILSELNINIGPILTGAGILGFALSFASQNLIRDYISGIFIMLEDQYRVGEEVEILGNKGKVLKLNLRSTILKDSEGKIYFLPNGQIQKVVNLSRKSEKI